MSIPSEWNIVLHIGQLIAWDKRRKGPVDKCNIYRIAPLSRLKPTSLVSTFPDLVHFMRVFVTFLNE